jgi:hypothetical protein
MGILRDLAHIARNMVKVNSLWHDVRAIVKRDKGVDLEHLPPDIRRRLYERVKDEYLSGETSAQSIAQLLLF